MIGGALMDGSDLVSFDCGFRLCFSIVFRRCLIVPECFPIDFRLNLSGFQCFSIAFDGFRWVSMVSMFFDSFRKGSKKGNLGPLSKRFLLGIGKSQVAGKARKRRLGRQ